MNSNTLQNLLIEYKQKKIEAEQKAEIEKQKLYEDFPDLLKIDEKLSSLSLSTIKEAIYHNQPDLLSNLYKEIDALKKEKQALLKKIGKRAENIFPHYECEKCQDTGYITTSNSTQMCSCLKQKIYDEEYNKSNLQNLELQQFKNFRLDVYSDKVNEEKYNSSISPRENIRLIQEICKNFIVNFDKPEEKNLLFTGKTGLGKTFLSGCIANELLKQGKTVLYQTASIMFDNIIQYRFGKENVSKDIYDYLLNVDLLIIDDLGTEGTNNLKLVELFNLLNSRLLNFKKPTKTIISTNLSLQSLFENYDERIVSRIVGNYHICYFFGDDIRFIKT